MLVPSLILRLTALTQAGPLPELTAHSAGSTECELESACLHSSVPELWTGIAQHVLLLTKLSPQHLDSPG